MRAFDASGVSSADARPTQPDAQLLAAKRGVRHPLLVPRLSARQILAWADAYRARTGNWLTCEGGPVEPGSEETWLKIDQALKHGTRGLKGRSSLFKVLARQRDVSRHVRKRPLSVDEVLRWADAHRRRTGEWPTNRGGAIPESPGESWALIDTMLREAKRGLPHSSLARLLAQHRGKRNIQDLPTLTIAQILKWARLHHQQHGVWPKRESGPIPGSYGETWCGVDLARRGLRTRTSLAQLLGRQEPMTGKDPGYTRAGRDSAQFAK